MNENKLVIRMANEGDLRRIISLHAHARKQSNVFIPKETYEKVVRGKLKDYSIILALVKGKLVGVFGVRKSGDEAHLDLQYVSTKYRRSGVYGGLGVTFALYKAALNHAFITLNAKRAVAVYATTDPNKLSKAFLVAELHGLQVDETGNFVFMTDKEYFGGSQK